MSENFTNILDQAIARIAAGESIETILADYPFQQHELAPLLYAAWELSSLRAVPPPLEPEAGLEVFLATARASRCEAVNQRRHRRWLAERLAGLEELWWHPRVRLTVGALTALILLFALMGSTVALAADSLPGDWLYPIKLANEEIRLSLTFDPAARAEYHLVRVQTRVQEIQRLVQADRPVDDKTLGRVNRSLEASLLAAASTDPTKITPLLATIEKTAAEQTSLVATVEVASTNTHNHQLLAQVRTNLSQARKLASVGQADLHAFRLSAKLGLLQIGGSSPTPLETGLPTATVTSTPTSNAPTATPTPTATASATPTVTARSSATATPTETAEPSRTPKPTRTPRPSPSPEPPTRTPPSSDETNTPQPPGQTKTPQPPGQTKTPQPPGQVKTPEPPGQVNTPQPPGQGKPKPTKKP